MANSSGPQDSPVASSTCPTQALAAAASLIASFLSASVAGARAEQAHVEITGGADVSGQNYSWTVTNHHSSPIVYIQFPHYFADTFLTPDGWERNCTNLIDVGVHAAPGTCTASVDSPERGIAPGRSADFGMRLARGGGHHRRPGQVTVHFANGTQTIVAGVELPTASTTPERLYALIGFALIFLIIVIVQTRRRRKAPPAPGSDSTPTADSG